MSEASPPRPLRAPMKYNPALDGLRTIAVLLVLLLHTTHRLPVPTAGGDYLLYTLLQCGWIGVDIFFVLSGFLITGILLSQRHVPVREYFQVFYARRSLRIFPLYFAVTLIGLALLKWLLHLGTSIDWAAILTYTQNLVWIFKPTKINNWFGHTWSLAVEEHFYLLWPIVVYLTPIRRLKLGIPIVALGILCFRLALLRTHFMASIAVATPTRCDSLFIGGLLAIFCHSEESGGFCLAPRAAMLLRIAAGISLAAFVAAGCYNRDFDVLTAFNRSVGFTCVAVFAAGVISECLSQGLLWHALSNRIMVDLGKISYGIYLLHLPIFTFLALQFSGRIASWPYALKFLALFAAASSVTVLASKISFTYFESRVLAYKRHFKYSKTVES